MIANLGTWMPEFRSGIFFCRKTRNNNGLTQYIYPWQPDNKTDLPGNDRSEKKVVI